MKSDNFFSLKYNVPKEIVNFIFDTFLLCEQRGTVGRKNGIIFEVRSRESNHFLPHIHAKYGEFEISIQIDNSQILAGNLPIKQRKIAQKWVEENKKQLLTKWKELRISTEFPNTESMLKYTNTNP